MWDTEKCHDETHAFQPRAHTAPEMYLGRNLCRGLQKRVLPKFEGSIRLYRNGAVFLFVLNKVQRPRHNFFNPPFSVSLHGRGTCVTFESEICEWRSSLEKPPIYRNTTAELGPLIFPVMETSQKKRNICFIALNAVSVLLSPPASTH